MLTIAYFSFITKLCLLQLSLGSGGYLEFLGPRPDKSNLDMITKKARNYLSTSESHGSIHDG